MYIQPLEKSYICHTFGEFSSTKDYLYCGTQASTLCLQYQKDENNYKRSFYRRLLIALQEAIA